MEHVCKTIFLVGRVVVVNLYCPGNGVVSRAFEGDSSSFHSVLTGSGMGFVSSHVQVTGVVINSYKQLRQRCISAKG